MLFRGPKSANLVSTTGANRQPSGSQLRAPESQHRATLRWSNRGSVQQTQGLRRVIESSGVRAAVTTVTVEAPACRRHAAAVTRVAPVVTTSSTNRTLAPTSSTDRLTVKARRRLLWRLERLSRVCGGVGRRRRSPRTTGSPSSAAKGLAIAAAWL